MILAMFRLPIIVEIYPTIDYLARVGSLTKRRLKRAALSHNAAVASDANVT